MSNGMAMILLFEINEKGNEGTKCYPALETL
jgi:hypothetical protein